MGYTAMIESVRLFRSITYLALLGLSLSGCATAMVGSAIVGTTATATRVAVKSTVGAGKLAYRGTKAAVKGTTRLLTDEEQDQLPQ